MSEEKGFYESRKKMFENKKLKAVYQNPFVYAIRAYEEELEKWKK